MKRSLSIFLISMIIVINFGSIVFAQGINTKNEQITIMMDYLPLDLSTISYNNTTYIPLKDACAYFNCDLKIDEKNNVINVLFGSDVVGISKPDKKIAVDGFTEKASVFNKYLIKINGIDSYFDSIYFNDNVYIPARYFAEVFNKKVEWNSAEKIITFSSFSTTNVGSVNGQDIKNYEFNYFFNPQLKQMMADGSYKDANEVKKVKQEIFDMIIIRKLLLQKAAENKIVLNDNDFNAINTSISEMIKNYDGVNNLRKILSEFDTNLNQVELFIRDNYLYSKLEHTLTFNIQPSEDMIQKYYDANKTSFLQPETVRAKHILILTMDSSGAPMELEKKAEAKKKAQSILDSINAGGDFGKLMKENSEDPGSAGAPDGYTFTRGMMVKEFEDAAFSLNVGQLSGIVESQYGYHIIKLEEKILGKQLTLDEVRASIIKNLQPQARETYFDTLITNWKADSKTVNGV